MKITSLFFALLLIITPLLSGQGITSGIVLDQDTNTPMVGVSILVEGTNKGTVSNIDGSYSIQNDGQTLRFSFIGYKEFIAENPEGSLNVNMITGDNQLLECPIFVIDKRIKSAHNYTLLEDKALNLQNQVDLSPILNTTPGVFMHSGALNTNRITIRGIGNRSPFATNKVKAYLNEIPLTNGSGETTIEDIDLSFIKDIEIWKGPTSSRYGAGLGGMILMNTINQSPSYFSIQHSLGNYGLQRNTLNLHLKNIKKGFDLHVNHNLTHSEGYRDNNNYRRQGFTLLSSANLEGDQLNVLVNFTRLKAFIPSSLSQEDFINEPTKAAFTWGRVKGFEDYNRVLAGISYDHNLNDFAKLKYAFFLNSKKSYELRPFNILTENSTSTGTRATFQWMPSHLLSFNIGTELFRESYNWETFATNNNGDLLEPLSINKETRLYGNLFAEAIYHFRNNWKLNGGINANATKYDLEDRFFSDSTDISGDYSFDPILSPRLTLTYSPRFNNDYYILLSHGFSPPSLEETLTPDGNINPEIQPEMAWNIELGTRSYYDYNRFTYELSLYSMRVKDLLVARRTDFDQYIGINAGKTIHNGVELQFSYDLVRELEKKLNLQISYSYSDYSFSTFIDGEEDYSGNELTGTAPHQFNSLLTWQLYGFYGNLNFLFMDAQPLRDDNSIYSDNYTLLHSKMGYKFSLKEKWSFDLFAGINNILDEHYAAMHQINANSFGGAAPRYYYPGLPRHFYAGFEVRYFFRKK